VQKISNLMALKNPLQRQAKSCNLQRPLGVTTQKKWGEKTKLEKEMTK